MASCKIKAIFNFVFAKDKASVVYFALLGDGAEGYRFEFQS